MKRAALVFAVLLFALPADAETAVPAPAPETARATIRIDQPWARPAGKGGESAVYLSITNTGREALILREVATPAADMAMLHETQVKNGVAEMREVEDLKIAPGETVDFTPKEKHVMLMGLGKNLKLGDRFPLNFRFDKGHASTEVPVQAGPAYTR